MGLAIEKLPAITMNFHMPVTPCQLLAYLLFHCFSYGQHHDHYSLIFAELFESKLWRLCPCLPLSTTTLALRNRDIILYTHVVMEPSETFMFRSQSL